MGWLATVFVVCFTPSLAWLGYFYIKDEYEREPLHLVLMVFGGGLLAGPLSLLLFEAIEHVSFYSDLMDIDLVPDFKKLLYAIFAIGLIEELSKFMVFWLFMNRNHVQFDEPIDGVVYAAAAALGFATIENWYFMLAAEEPIWTRAITLPFNHALFASFWGAAAGLAAVERRGAKLIIKGLVLAIVFHGLYDYILFSDEVPNVLIGPLVVVMWLWVSLVIRNLLNRSPYRPLDN